MKTSNFLSLNWYDLGKALLVALITLLFSFAQETFIPALNVSPEIKLLLLAGLGYLAKNWLTPSPEQIKQLQRNLKS